jgi:S-DNA-T family DNA segregation ATPase FtsK/SpoIIIE
MDTEPTDDEQAKILLDQFGIYDPHLDLPNYYYPTLDLLTYYESQVSSNERLERNKDIIVETLHYADVEISQIKATVGPTLTLFEITPAPGIRVAKIKNLQADLSLRLAADVTIIGPILGKGTMGIELPHLIPDTVSMRLILATEKSIQAHMDLPIAVGRYMDNNPYVADLAKLPHLLVGGATGQGKSVCLNAMLISLLYNKHPSDLKFVLIDVNNLELSLFSRIEHHFLAKLPGQTNAVVTDITNAIQTLQALCLEMDQRYNLLNSAGVRHIREYNLKFINRQLKISEGHCYLPFIVLVIDEFAELLTPDREVELAINRLAQLGRSAGIHLIISTQRPSVKIITGTIKANFTSRISFRVSSSIDSRTVLEVGGAELLNGQGDMLLSDGTELIHLQGALVTTAEVERVCEFIGNQRGYPSAFLLSEHLKENIGSLEFDPDHLDPLFEEAARLVVMHQQGSTSLIQRKLKLGYNRAGRIIDHLEAQGIVGPFDGSKARDVLCGDADQLESHLKGVKPTNAPIVQQEDSVTVPEDQKIEVIKEPEIMPAGLIPVLPAEPEQKRRSFWSRLFK